MTAQYQNAAAAGGAGIGISAGKKASEPNKDAGSTVAPKLDERMLLEIYSVSWPRGRGPDRNIAMRLPPNVRPPDGFYYLVRKE